MMFNALWFSVHVSIYITERLAAAKKYGLIPEDYKPYPPDAFWNEHVGPQGLGDYPMLQKSSQDSRSGHINWDDPDLKRNFGEPLQYNYYLNQETKHDDTTRPRYPLWQTLLCFLGTFAFFASPYYFMRNYPLHPPTTKAQLPKPGTVYYTFEPVDK